MSVLVTAASEHGATREIAARIGAELAEHGIDVDLEEPEKVQDLAQYDGFVVGSALYLTGGFGTGPSRIWGPPPMSRPARRCESGVRNTGGVRWHSARRLRPGGSAPSRFS